MAENEKSEGPRSFARFIEMVSDGACQSEASAELLKLCNTLREDAAARSATSKGEITLRIGLAVEPSGVVGVAYDVKIKEPPKARPKGVLWLTKGGNLTPQNPRQQTLPLREVGGTAEPAREVRDDAAAREV